MNTELLLKVKEAILQEPDRFHMGNWRMFRHPKAGLYSCPVDLELVGIPMSECETVHCIAGWALVLSESVDTAWYNAEGHGRDRLGLNPVQSKRLFYDTQWPSEFLNAYRNTKDNRVRAKVAAKRIEHFILTNGEE